jgi:ketosteroid isomerase-like protein
MTDRGHVSRWLDEYIEAWRSNDRDRIAALFSDDVSYRYYPYKDPVVGAQAVADAWLADQDDPDGWTASYEPIAVDGNVAVATGESVYTDPDGTVREAFDNCFVIRFGDDGLCREFTEYYVKRPKNADA